jgi:mRNA (2'-O-methyladenosine-N6-)-methyltransferase
LHYEVDWDEKDVDANGTGKEREMPIKKPYRIGIGMGPDGKDMQVVSRALV